MSAIQQWQLASPASDGVSSVRFSRVSNNLITTSWDKVLGDSDLFFFCRGDFLFFSQKGVRVYEASQNQLLAKYDHQNAALDGKDKDQVSSLFSHKYFLSFPHGPQPCLERTTLAASLSASTNKSSCMTCIFPLLVICASAHTNCFLAFPRHSGTT